MVGTAATDCGYRPGSSGLHSLLLLLLLFPSSSVGVSLLVPVDVLVPVPRLGGSGGPGELGFSEGVFEAVDADVFVRFGSGGGFSGSVVPALVFVFDCEGFG